MWKVSHYIVLIVIGGAAVVGFWVYQKYVRDTGPKDISVMVERGDIEEIVRARGEVVAANEYNLEFASSGIVRSVYVHEGQKVAAGTPLMSLDSGELTLEEERSAALVAQRQADLAKLLAGASATDIAVYEARVASASASLHETESAEILALRTVYTAMDDAVKGTTDAFYSNPNSSLPQLSFSIPDSTLRNILQAERTALTELLDRAAASVSSAADLHAAAVQMQAYAKQIGAFLDNNTAALNTAISGNVSASTIDTWKTAVAAARTTLNLRASALAAAEESRTNAAAALVVAQKELTARTTASRSEDIAAAEAALNEAKAQVKIAQEKIRKATLLAPTEGKILKVAYKAGEAFRQGNPAVILYALPLKIQSDVSELDIVRVREQAGLQARITFDALDEKQYTGEVTTVEPRKIDKDGDTYYRVNFSLTDGDDAIRPGMTADVLISVSKKTNVLKIPEYVFYIRDEISYVRVEREGVSQEITVELGLSDGEFREVVSGLSEGERVIISAN